MNNTMKANQARSSEDGIVVRLRSTWLRLINSMTPAMAGEPAGAVEAVQALRDLGSGAQSGEEPGIDFDAESSRAERLMRSACDLLCNQPVTLISATSLSLPREPGLTMQQLADAASVVAIEYGVLADVAVNGDHVNVRLTRRVPSVPSNEKQFAAPISARGPRKGRN